MSWDEFVLWMNEYKRSPWGPERDGLHAAVVAQTVANFAGKTIKGDGQAKLSEFLLDFGRKADDEEIVISEPDPIAHFKSVQVRA